MQARFDFCEQVLAVDPRRLIFVDEFGANLAMTRWYARAPVGQRAFGSAPACYGGNVTLVFGLRLTGVVAPFVLPGAMNNDAFVTYVEHVLAPTLRDGDVVVMDRLPAHRQPLVAAMIAATGARLLPLPPYAPDLSPVEAAGSKVKTRLRSVAARTYDLLVEAFGAALDDVTHDDAVGWFFHYGYLDPPEGKPR